MTTAPLRSEPPGVAYVLAKPDYFTEGRRGRVSHALGVAEGLASAGIPVWLFSGPGLRQYVEPLGPSVRAVEVPPSLSLRRWRKDLQREVDRLLTRTSGIEHVIIRYAMSQGASFSSLIRRHPNRLWTFEVNSLLVHNYPRLPSALKKIALAVEQRILSQADVVYVVSSQIRTDLTAESGRLAADSVVVVPNAGPSRLGASAWPAERPGSDGPVRLVYFGVLQTYYEFDVLVDAFRQIYRESSGAVELHVHGDGPQYESLRFRARSHPAIFLHGRYDLAELLSGGMLDRNTVLLLPYRDMPITRIGSPIKLFEYMALGLPILSSSTAQLSEVLAHKRTAYLYEPGNCASLVNGLRWMLANPLQRAALGREARSAFLARHTWEERMRQLFNFLESRRVTTGQGTLLTQ